MDKVADVNLHPWCCRAVFQNERLQRVFDVIDSHSAGATCRWLG